MTAFGSLIILIFFGLMAFMIWATAEDSSDE